MLDRPSTPISSDLISSCSGPRNPSARNTRSAGKNFSEPIWEEGSGDQESQVRTRAAKVKDRGNRTHDLLHLPRSSGVLCPLDSDGVEPDELAVLVLDKVLGRDRVLSRVVPKVGADLGVSIVDSEHPRERRPRVVSSPRRRRSRQELKVGDRLCSVSHRGSDAVVSGVSSADDDHVLALGVDVVVVRELRVEQRGRVELEEVHREMDPIRLAVGDLEVSRPGRSRRDDDRVRLGSDRLGIDVLANMGVRDEVLRKRGEKQSRRGQPSEERRKMARGGLTIPSAAMRSIRRWTMLLSSFMFGIPYI